MENTQQKINTALSLLQYISNTLNIVNTEMRMQPSQGNMAVQFQIERCLQHDEFASRLIEIANDFGDLMEDSFDEDELDFINPMFEFINKED